MDCLPLQRSPGPFQYLIHEQAKSLVALQELQNEVGALLEFRDLVMETFPHLRTKMAAVSTASTASTSSQPPPSNIPVPLARSREWEPGVRVRRRLQPHAASSPGGGKQQDSDVTGRGGKAPKSDGGGGGGGGGAVQDSGFGTETSSSTSKEASSGVGAPKSCPGGGGGGAPDEEAGDELWNLLDVIHRKGSRLRDEVEVLQARLQGGEERRHSLGAAGAAPATAGAVTHRWGRRCESLGLLLDKVAAAESEAAQLRAELAELRLAKEDLQTQLRAAPAAPGTQGRRLGALDGVVSSPRQLRRAAREVRPDPAKVRAILGEMDPVELQRHLITTSVEKQALEQRLDKSERSHADLLEQLDKVKDENEDLRFQLEEKSIELEGTRARVRVLERLHHKASLDGSSLLPPAPNTILPLLALPMPVEEPNQLHHHSSSTESAHDQTLDVESKKSSEMEMCGDSETNHSLGDDFADHVGESFSDSLDEEIDRLRFRGTNDLTSDGLQQPAIDRPRGTKAGAMYPWHSSSSEYFDSINNSFDGSYRDQRSQREGPADCDSLEKCTVDRIDAKSSCKLWLTSEPMAGEW